VGDFEAEMKSYTESAKEKKYKMPDGNIIDGLGNQLFKCPEALF